MAEGSGPVAMVRGVSVVKPCDHDSYPLYKRLIDPLREKARELGYSLAVHGTLKRDIDLIACPWADKAVDARTLAEALLKTAANHNGGTAFLNPRQDNGYFWAGQPGYKSHGRLCWSIYLGGPTYIDLSVMPKAAELTSEEIVAARQEAERRGPMISYIGGNPCSGAP
ncbi:MAG: hypothetical protein KGL39_08040 [Patescibacteria group bacterium]|nr:hypothetical protein [Patescibacteria group bacterium]